MRNWLHTMALVVVLVIVGLRPLISESYDTAPAPIGEAITAIADPTPVRTLAIDLFVLLAAAGWAVLHAGGAGRYRCTGLEIGGLLILAAAIVSTLAAGQQRLALNASLDWLCLLVLAITVAQLARTAWARQLLLAVVVASAVAQAGKCLDEYFFTYASTVANYEEMKDEFWAAQGVALDDPQVELYERRLASREAQGYLAHPNITGSHLVLGAFVAGAAGLAALRRRRNALETACGAGSLAFGAALLAATLMTGSVGALASAGVALLLGGALWLLRGWTARRRRLAWGIAWLGVAGAAAAVIGHGLTWGHLPTASLDFRWQYWRASAPLIADHPLTGVGRENFGRHYLAYKSIDSPEEIRNPHNLFVEATAEWGALGGAGLLALLLAGSWRYVRPRRTPGGPELSAQPPPGATRLAPWLLGLPAVVMLVRAALLGSDNLAFVYSDSVVAGLTWLLGLAVVAGARDGSLPDGRVSAGEAPDATPAGDGILRLGVGLGLVAFLLHDMINFALFVPGTATPFFALVGWGLADWTADSPAADRAHRPVAPLVRWAPIGMAGVALLALLGLGLRPVSRCVSEMDAARAVRLQLVPVGPAAQPAYEHYANAAAADPLDPTPLLERARWLVAVAAAGRFEHDALTLAEQAVREGESRDPDGLAPPRLLVRIGQAQAELADNEDARVAGLQLALTAAERAQQLYPQSPTNLAMVGDCAWALAQATADRSHAKSAVAALEQALALDDARPAWEVIRRFPPRRRREIEQQWATILRWLEAQP